MTEDERDINGEILGEEDTCGKGDTKEAIKVKGGSTKGDVRVRNDEGNLHVLFLPWGKGPIG